ncbi:hypothetical protein ACP70R_037671 [Stipagrostis hirtigluma subsp. patula]
MSQPRTVDAGGRQKPASTFPRILISDMWELAFMSCVITIPWYIVFFDQPPQFSVQLVAPAGRGLDDASTSAVSTAAMSAFHVALHASNRRATERCYRGGEAVVAYAGFDVASGRVPGFCVRGRGRREVPFLLMPREDGASLPENLRDRMAAAQKVGALELEVQVRLSQGAAAASGTGRPMRMWCKARTGGPDVSVTMCTVFALQNWFDVGG